MKPRQANKAAPLYACSKLGKLATRTRMQITDAVLPRLKLRYVARVPPNYYIKLGKNVRNFVVRHEDLQRIANAKSCRPSCR